MHPITLAKIYNSLGLTLSSGLQTPLGSSPSKIHGNHHLFSRPELPGGSPFSLCDVSQPTDLFQIDSIELSKQPVYIGDAVLFHLYGEFQGSFTPNATMNFRVDCGSHCEEYGGPPGEREGESGEMPFCDLTEIEQPLGGGKRNETCPPVEGHALLTSPGYAWRMFFGAPGWYNFTFDAKTAEGDRIYCVTAEVCLRYEDEDENKRYRPTPARDCKWPR
ncbi:hypothetical protein F5B22DRAFT_643428 [Xylaria bambusicola]|uniref:uncharacterized protein n=1 Tax=Xylaria bambusicola TaxID=326684 RepID=UPI00200863DE|nr:uncharacterized protein F5B22DRAFT_643428 [Xylaria bambusicola]KAI0521842.1 hypothetical protein F5B22DRAFT_643428 [Xylaria bambusicola]